MLRIGKLYKCPEFHLLIFPTKEKLIEAIEASSMSISTTKIWPGATEPHYLAMRRVKYWSDRLNCKVRFIGPNEVFMIVSRENDSIHALFGDKQGWVMNEQWMNFEDCKFMKLSLM